MWEAYQLLYHWLVLSREVDFYRFLPFLQLTENEPIYRLRSEILYLENIPFYFAEQGVIFSFQPNIQIVLKCLEGFIGGHFKRVTFMRVFAHNLFKPVLHFNDSAVELRILESHLFNVRIYFNHTLFHLVMIFNLKKVSKSIRIVVIAPAPSDH